MRKRAIAVIGLLVAGVALGAILLPDGSAMLENLANGATIVFRNRDAQ